MRLHCLPRTCSRAHEHTTHVRQDAWRLRQVTRPLRACPAAPRGAAVREPGSTSPAPGTRHHCAKMVPPAHGLCDQSKAQTKLDATGWHAERILASLTKSASTLPCPEGSHSHTRCRRKWGPGRRGRRISSALMPGPTWRLYRRWCGSSTLPPIRCMPRWAHWVTRSSRPLHVVQSGEYFSGQPCLGLVWAHSLCGCVSV